MAIKIKDKQQCIHTITITVSFSDSALLLCGCSHSISYAQSRQQNHNSSSYYKIADTEPKQKYFFTVSIHITYFDLVDINT